MNIEFFIARRLLKSKGKRFSGPIIKIATWSIALGVAVMLISMAVLQGFQNGIREKIIGFGSHIQVLPFAYEQGEYSTPLNLGDSTELKKLSELKEVKHIQPYAVKGGIVKTDREFHGVVLKGVGQEFDTSFLARNLKSGRMPSFNATSKQNNEVLISENLARSLHLQLNDKLRMYFYVDGTYRVRAFSITGIYNTGLGMYDNQMVFCALHHIQKLNQWESNEVSGIEILLYHLDKIRTSENNIYKMIGQDETIVTLRDMESSLFSWLDLLDSNVVMILILMALVVIITMVATLLILIFERTNTIGILKTFGTSSGKTAKIFLYQACIIIVQGLLIGNIISGMFYFIQNHWKPLKLDSQNYFLDAVPVELSMTQVIVVNIAVLLLCYATMLLPAHYINKIHPVKALQFE